MHKIDISPELYQLQPHQWMHQQEPTTLQTHHVCSTLKRRRNDRFHVVSTWNTRGMIVGNIQELVIEMCSDLFNNGRMVTGDRWYSAIDTAEMLYKKEVDDLLPNNN